MGPPLERGQLSPPGWGRGLCGVTVALPCGKGPGAMLVPPRLAGWGGMSGGAGGGQHVGFLGGKA